MTRGTFSQLPADVKGGRGPPDVWGVEWRWGGSGVFSAVGGEDLHSQLQQRAKGFNDEDHHVLSSVAFQSAGATRERVPLGSASRQRQGAGSVSLRGANAPHQEGWLQAAALQAATGSLVVWIRLKTCGNDASRLPEVFLGGLKRGFEGRTFNTVIRPSRSRIGIGLTLGDVYLESGCDRSRRAAM